MVEKVLTLFLLSIFVFGCKREESSKNKNQVKIAEVKEIKSKDYKNKYWFSGKSFEYITRETKDSLIVGDYISNGKAITFLSKDTLLISDHLDGVTLKINKIETNNNDSIKISTTSFYDNSERMDLGLYLVNKIDSLWIVDSFGQSFYALDDLKSKSDFFIYSSNLKYKMIPNINKLEDPIMYEDEEDSIPYFYRVKKSNN